MSRLTEWIDDGENRYAVPRMELKNNGHRACCNKLAYYEDLAEQGRLLELLCGVGDIVYTNMRVSGWYFKEKDKPYKAEVVFIGVNRTDNFVNVVFENGNMLQFKFSDLGETWFLTKEEAEKALEEHARKQ